MKIAIVILNWNGKELLEKFLPSVIKFSTEADIYVADNASTDDSIDYIKTMFPTVTIIQNKTNDGFAKGYNLALKNVDATVFGLLNSDIEVTENWLQPIITKYRNDYSTCIVQPKILDYKQKTHFEYAGAAGGFIDKYGFPYCKGRIFENLEEDKNQYSSGEIFWASGAAFFIKKEAYDQLNGFDEDYFAHFEEIDLCWRAKNLGFKIESILESTVYHVGGATLKNSNPYKTYLNFRNSLFSLVKNLPKEKLFSIIFIRMVLDGVAGVRFLFQGELKHLFAILKAHISFYKNLRLFLNKRNSSTIKNYYQTTSIVRSHFLNKNKNVY